MARAAAPDDLVPMAHVKEPYGLSGRVKLYTYSGDPLALAEIAGWWISGAPPGSREWVALTPDEVNEHGGFLVAKFPGVDDRDAAVALKGRQIAVRRSAFPANVAGEYYWSDLIGLEVKNRDGLLFGLVENLLDLGPHQVLRVTGGEREVLIPFVAQYVDAVDVAAKLITVDWGMDY